MTAFGCRLKTCSAVFGGQIVYRTIFGRPMNPPFQSTRKPTLFENLIFGFFIHGEALFAQPIDQFVHGNRCREYCRNAPGKLLVSFGKIARKSSGNFRRPWKRRKEKKIAAYCEHCQQDKAPRQQFPDHSEFRCSGRDIDHARLRTVPHWSKRVFCPSMLCQSIQLVRQVASPVFVAILGSNLKPDSGRAWRHHIRHFPCDASKKTMAQR